MRARPLHYYDSVVEGAGSSLRICKRASFAVGLHRCIANAWCCISFAFLTFQELSKGSLRSGSGLWSYRDPGHSKSILDISSVNSCLKGEVCQ